MMPPLFPLSHAQRRIWYMEQLYPDTCAHVLGGVVRIHGAVELALLDRAIRGFIEKNTAIRLQLCAGAEGVRQYVAAPLREPLRFVDFTKERDPEAAAVRWIDREFTTPFSLLEHPLYDFALLRIGEGLFGYYLKLHHVVADGWTIQLLTDQVSALYGQLERGEAIDAPSATPVIDYATYVASELEYLASQRCARDREYWLRTFAEHPVDVDASRSPDVSARRKTFRMGVELSDRLRRLKSERRWSLNAVFTGAMALHLRQARRGDDVVLGIPVFNRRGEAQLSTAGMFTSSMPLRATVPRNESLAGFQDRIARQLRASFLHQRYPYDLLVEELGKRSGKRIEGLFDACVNYYNTRPALRIGGHRVENVEWFSGAQTYSVQVVVKDWSETNELECMIDARCRGWGEESVAALFLSLEHYARRLTEDPDSAALASAPSARREAAPAPVVAAWSGSVAPVHVLFERQASRLPERIAVSSASSTWTYAALNARANQIARGLQKRGVGRESVVAVWSAHSPDLVAALLAILKSGGAWLPIDPTTPSERAEFMLANGGAHVLVTDGRSAPTGFTGIVLALDDHAWVSETNTDLGVDVAPNELAYMIYTSGSTGRPKGVMIEHRSFANYVSWAAASYIERDDECFALHSSIAFDLTVTSIFAPLTVGGSIRVYPATEGEFALDRVMGENACSLLKLTPAHLKLLRKGAGPSRVRCVVVGGEDLRRKTAQAARGLLGDGVRIVNEYGPTEATVGCSAWTFDPAQPSGESVPIGVPVRDSQMYVLDANLAPVPDGVVGEIFIAGAGLARGYRERPDLTAERFIPSPFAHGARMYRTGDLGRARNGVFEYCGRIDDQLKLRGYRIEPAEIEAELLRHEAIDRAVVVVAKGARERLVAFVGGLAEVPRMEVKRFLSRALPSFMIPEAIVWRSAWPLSDNGKIDRAALAAAASDVSEWPVGDVEIPHELLDALQRTLETAAVSASVNVYSLGMDSIKAIQLSAKLRAAGFELSPQDVLTFPVVGELAQVMRKSARSEPGAAPCRGDLGRLPMIEWFREQRFADPSYYHQSVTLDLATPVSHQALEEALRVLVRRHDALRLNQRSASGAFFFEPEYCAGDLSVLRVATISELSDEAAEAAERDACESLFRSISLARGPLFRGLLVQRASRADRLVLAAHHAVIDAVSWRILLEELEDMLEADGAGESRLPPKGASLQAWVEVLARYAEHATVGEIELWRRDLGPPTSLPADFDRGAADYRSRAVCAFELTTAETSRLTKGARAFHGCGAHELVLAALVATLADLTARSDVAIEIESHGREQVATDVDVSRTVGWFTAMYPVRFSVPTGALADRVAAIAAQHRSLPRHGLGYGALKYACGEPLETWGARAIRFNYLGESDTGFAGRVLRIVSERSRAESSPDNALTCAVDVIAAINAGRLRTELHFSTNRYDTMTMQGLAEAFQVQLLALIGTCCAVELGDLDDGSAPPTSAFDASLGPDELELLLKD